MKHFYTFIFLLATYLTFGQINPNQYDYFVQFNGNQLSKKVSVTEILNHPIITKYSNNKPDLDFSKYTSVIQLDQKITIHGKFSDSIPYYQVTIPIKSREAVKQFLIKEYGANTKNDSVENAQIQDFDKYAVFNPVGKNKSWIWNDNYLVILELTRRTPSRYTIPAAMVSDDSTAVEEIYDETQTVEPTIIIDTPANDPAVITEAPAPYDYDPNAEINIEDEIFNREQAEKQNQLIKTLFENGFTAPSSEKINANADISSWLNYSAVMSKMYSSYSYPMAIFGGYDKFLPMQKNFGDFIKGINLDFYFENNNARVEEVIEYSEQMAEVVNKITNRKINKNLFAYFPKEKPMAYMSYHLNTKAALENFPSLTADIFQSPKLLKEDITIVTDLISTIVDEEATATLFDGDLSMFLYDFKEVEVMTKSYAYDENYEETVTDKMVKKSIPLFSLVFTSTHPTFGDKLIHLGVRKKVLVQKDNYFIITGTKEYGDVFIKKDKDVVVVSNTLEYFADHDGSFTKEAKKDLKKNYMFGKLNIAQLIQAYNKSEEVKSEEASKLKRVSEQFSDITMESPKKMVNNKLIFSLKLNTLKSDKNIILQTLDLAEELTAK